MLTISTLKVKTAKGDPPMTTPDDAEPGSVHPPIHKITDALSFKLARLNAINERAGSYHFRRHHDITLTNWRILGLVAAMEPAPSREVRDTLYMDKGQFSRAVSQLTERGLLEASPAATNASAINLRLTEAGRDLHAVLIRFTAERNASTASVLSAEECRTFLHLLDRVWAHAHALVMNRRPPG
jgi:DNA-binding MarR family transcriptional regulator